MWRKTWLFFSQAVTVAVAALFVVATLQPDWLPGGRSAGLLQQAPTLTQIISPSAPATAASAAAGSFAWAAQRAAPAVVSVTASRMANPHADDPRFRDFFNRNPQPQRSMPTQLGLGSGVIVAAEGYLLTNHHVIEGATDILVRLPDGREAAAKLVGSDAETDIAVLKIDLPDLPVMTLGDVSGLQVGDPVLAIGNPFDVGQTVTAGIVSALGRQTRQSSPLQAFVQTDAAINPGNSGGALVDAQGRLVGINTAIFSRGGGSNGVGFAVPVDTARQVMEQIVTSGRVQRGWIGVEPRELSAELADSLNVPVRAGVLITGVLQDGPAARGGLRPGDVVLRVGDASVKTPTELLTAVAALPPDTETVLAVQRGPQALEVKVRLGNRENVLQGGRRR
jgi:Do/DeqQ family serine protease